MLWQQLNESGSLIVATVALVFQIADFRRRR